MSEELKPCPFCGVAAHATNEMFGSNINCDHLNTCPLDGHEKLAASVKEWNARVQPSDGALTNEGAEPVAWRFRVSDGSDWFTTTRKDVAELFRKSPDGSHSEPLYRRQPAPASVVLPERISTSMGNYSASQHSSGWNACLDEFKRLNPTL